MGMVKAVSQNDVRAKHADISISVRIVVKQDIAIKNVVKGSNGRPVAR